jgi:hypothetical protein
MDKIDIRPLWEELEKPDAEAGGEPLVNLW